jgi:hypothetical protein
MIFFLRSPLHMETLLVRLGIEFLKLELNFNSIYKYRGKKLCLGVEF